MTTTRRETFNYGGEMEQEQLQSLLAAYEEMYKDEEETEENLQEEDPCWKGYTQVGMKKKGGREVPNCVPSKGVPDAKGYKKEETEIEEGIAANLLRLGLAAGTAAFGANVMKQAKDVKGRIEKTQKDKEKMVNDILRNSYESEGEVVEAYDVLLNHLMSEGFASDVTSAEKIMSVMSDDWMQSILNQK